MGLECSLQICLDLWDWKVRLINRGVFFGDVHQRLSGGNFSRSTLRLCHEYDVLWEQWLETVDYPCPAGEDSDRESVRNHYRKDSSWSSGGEDADLYDADVESHRSFDISSCIRVARKTGVPQNIGWRFSDDVEPIFQSMNWRLHEEAESTVRSQESQESPIQTTTTTTAEPPHPLPKQEAGKRRERARLRKRPPKKFSIYPASRGAFQSEMLDDKTNPPPKASKFSTIW